MEKVNSESSQGAVQKSNDTELNKLRLVFEQTPGAIFILDKNFRFEYVNPSFTKLSGYSKEELISKTVGELFYHKDVPDTRFEVVKSLMAGEKWQGELLTYNKNGSTYWANTIAAPYKDDSGNIEGYVIIQQDTTERRRMEVSLKESEQFYRTLIESSMDAVSLNQDGRFLLVNSAFCKMFGYTNEEIFNMEPPSFIAPEDRERVMDLHYRRMRGEIERQNYTASFMHKSGKKVLTQLNATTVQVNGKNASFITMSDITERTEMENALRESEAKYKTLVENSQDGILIVRDNRVLFANNTICKVLGYCAEGLDLLSSVDIIHPDDRYKVRAIGERRRNQDFSTINETFRMIAKNGEIKECETTSTLIEFEGQWASFFTIHDITENKRMQLELKESELKYKTLIENSQDGIFAIVEEKILFANNTFCKIVGYTAEELYNKPASSLVFEEDRPRGLAISERRRQGDHSTVNDIFRFVAKDGSLREADVFSSVLELNGQVVSYITVHDLTETRRMQEQLQQSEEKYRTVIDKATDGIVITQQGRLKFVNNSLCEMLQYQEAELIEMPFLNLVVEEDQQVMKDFHKRRMAGEDFTALYRSRIIRKDGKIITVELNARTSNYNGNPAAFIIIRNITDRIKIENELQTAKNNLELLNTQLEKRVKESSESLTEARTQLINLQKENLQSQFDVLKQQVNPHFLFNSLNVLTSLIKLEPDLAEKFSEQLSKVYRYVLENKDNELVDLHTELNFLDAYIFLLNIRFVGKLKVNISIPDNRRSDQIIPLAMQLLIENAIKHNIMSKSEPLTIDIYIDEDNFLNIVNNLQERPSQLVSTGVGLKNIQNRYLLLNNTKPTFEKTNTHFIAKVPLVVLA